MDIIYSINNIQLSCFSRCLTWIICLLSSSDAADKVGSLQKCEAIQKQAYAKLAKDPVCFGDNIAEWSPDVIRVLGVQIGRYSIDMSQTNKQTNKK